LNVVTVASSLMLVLSGFAGAVYLFVALAAGAFFLKTNMKLLTAPSEGQGFKVFLSSMPYLMCLMFGLLADKLFFIV